jgi:hypothetical protein
MAGTTRRRDKGGRAPACLDFQAQTGTVANGRIWQAEGKHDAKTAFMGSKTGQTT